MEKHWVGQQQFDKHMDKFGSFVIISGEKWYIGPPSPRDAQEELDNYPEWIDISLLLFCSCVLMAAAIIYVWG